MKELSSGGVIIYGINKNDVINKAYTIAIRYMTRGCDDNNIEKYVYNNTHPDFLYVSKKDDRSEISIEDTRKIIEFLYKKPGLYDRKAIIINEANNMSVNASNSILKILEEHLTDTVIILISNNLFSILPTVRSRCIKIKVKTSNVTASQFINPEDFIKEILKSTPTSFINTVSDFIRNGFKDKMNFSKQYSEQADDFAHVVLMYYYFFSIKNNDHDIANKFLKLQEFYNSTINSYLDKQSVILSMLC